jgi:hypothetical protein
MNDSRYLALWRFLGNPIVGFHTILRLKMRGFFHISLTQHPAIPHKKTLAEVGYLHLHTVGFNTK